MTFSLKRFLRKSYLVRSVYWLTVLNWFDVAAMLTGRPRKRWTEKNRVAFVKMDGIGDYVIWSAIFDKLRDRYPSGEFDLLLIGNDRFEQLAENEKIFDEKIFVNLDRFAISPGYRFRLMKQIRDLGAETIINSRSARDLLWSDSMVRCSGAHERIGSEGTGNLMGPIQARWTRRWYTELRRPSVPGEHELITSSRFFGFPADQLKLGMDSGIGLKGPEVPSTFALFFPGAQIKEKSWPAERFALVAESIHRKYGLTPVFCGGPDDLWLVPNVKKALSCPYVDLIGKTSLFELASLLAKATIIVSNDTGAAHIAVMKHTPLVVIASGNEVGRYFPYPEAVRDRVEVIQNPDLCVGCKEACIHSRWSKHIRPCIEAVSVDKVLVAVDSVMGN